MASVAKRCLPFGLLAAACAWISFANGSLGDYPVDGSLAVHALADGDVSTYLSLHLLMGPFATLVQAPFAAIGGNEGLVAYQWACLPCLFAVGLLGLYLARLARGRGMSALGSWAIAAACLINPITFAAIEAGHPEELLTGALAIAAVAVASQGQGRRAALLLGLALASKQWAVLAILPVLMALPARRLRVALGAGAVAALLFLPGFLTAPGEFFDTQGHAAVTERIVAPWSVWYPIGTVTTAETRFGSVDYGVDVHRAPQLVTSGSHSLIVLLAVALPLLLALRRRRFGLAPGEAMALLALIGLLRCALDPVDNLYYHLPLLLALAGWDAVEAPRLPLRTLTATAVFFLFDYWSRTFTDFTLFNAAYVSVSLAVGVALAVVLFVPPAGRRSVRRGLDVRLTPTS